MVCPRWRANWDVLIKRGKRGLLTFYDVEEGGKRRLGEGGAKERGGEEKFQEFNGSAL